MGIRDVCFSGWLRNEVLHSFTILGFRNNGNYYSTLGLYREYWGYIGRMERNMKTTVVYYVFSFRA